MDNTQIVSDKKTAARLTGMIGLARRAGRLTYGFDAVAQDISAGKAKAALLSEDASQRTAKKIKDIGSRFNVRVVVLPVSKISLGNAIGRDDTAVIAITERAFADKILELADAGNQSAEKSFLKECSDGRPDGITDSGGN